MVVQVGFQAYSCISRINVPDKPKSAADLRNKRELSQLIAQQRVGLTALKVEPRDLLGGRLTLAVLGNLASAPENWYIWRLLTSGSATTLVLMIWMDSLAAECLPAISM